jgi:hypothetical protein
MQTPVIMTPVTARSAALEALTGTIEISAFITPEVIVELSNCQPLVKAFSGQFILSHRA